MGTTQYDGGIVLVSMGMAGILDGFLPLLGYPGNGKASAYGVVASDLIAKVSLAFSSCTSILHPKMKLVPNADQSCRVGESYKYNRAPPDGQVPVPSREIASQNWFGSISYRLIVLTPWARVYGLRNLASKW
jgi:hypothetical protein